MRRWSINCLGLSLVFFGGPIRLARAGVHLRLGCLWVWESCCHVGLRLMSGYRALCAVYSGISSESCVRNCSAVPPGSASSCCACVSKSLPPDSPKNLYEATLRAFRFLGSARSRSPCSTGRALRVFQGRVLFRLLLQLRFTLDISAAALSGVGVRPRGHLDRAPADGMLRREQLWQFMIPRRARAVFEIFAAGVDGGIAVCDEVTRGCLCRDWRKWAVDLCRCFGLASEQIDDCA